MVSLTNDDTAVSPVIGTILLVAIVVVLIAIVAAIVMGLAGNISSHKDIGITVEPGYWTQTHDDTGVVDSVVAVWVTIYGGNDVDKLTALNVSVSGTEGTVYHHIMTLGDGATAETPITNPVGVPIYYIPAPQSPDGLMDRVVTVTGTFNDGTSTVLVQKRMSLYLPDGTVLLQETEGWGPGGYLELALNEGFVFSPKFP